MLEFLKNWFFETYHIVYESGGWLLLGFFIAGIIHYCLPLNFVQKSLSKPGLPSILKAALFGLPMPLCSCSVIPVAISLRRNGASKGATSSFLVSTPEIGIDSALLSYGLLGLPFTLLRILSAFVSAVLAGVLVDNTNDHGSSMEESETSCCSNHNHDEKNTGNEETSIKNILKYSFITLPKDLAKLLIIGFILAGLAATILPKDTLFFDISPLLLYPLALISSLPVYVCAASMTPFAAVLLERGVSGGAVLIFLLAGPASNISTILAVKKELGKNAMIAYLLAVSLMALLVGILVDMLKLLG